MARDALDYIDTRSRQWRQTIPEHVRQTTQAVLADDDDERERRSPQLARRRFVKELARINKRQCLLHSDWVSLADVQLYGAVCNQKVMFVRAHCFDLVGIQCSHTKPDKLLSCVCSCCSGRRRSCRNVKTD